MTERKNIYQRMHAVMGAVDYIQKEKKQGMRYSIVSHDAVTAKVRPLLHENGIVYYPSKINRSHNGNRAEVDMLVRFVAIDDASDFLEVATAGYGVDDSDKGIGKAISYGVKYALLKALGLETGDDPDLDQDTKHDPKKEPPPPRPAPGPRSVERGTPIRDAREEIQNGTASTVQQHPRATKVGDPKAWAASADAGDFLRDARADHGMIQNGDDFRRWMEANRWEHDAIIEHGGSITNKAGLSRTQFLNNLIGETQARIGARAPVNLRAAG